MAKTPKTPKPAPPAATSAPPPRWRVEHAPVDSVAPNSYNPNRHDDRTFTLLLKSIREDGFTQPIVVHRQTRQIVDGEHRWRAARELGLATIPVVLVEMTPEQMRIATLRHNRARGAEDEDLVADVLRTLRDLGALDAAKDALVLDDAELRRLLDEAAAAVPDGPADGLGSTPSPLDVAPEVDTSADTARAREKLLAAQEDKVSDTYRLRVTYTNAQAALVRSVLGADPATKLLELCRAHAAGLPPQPPGDTHAARPSNRPD